MGIKGGEVRSLRLGACWSAMDHVAALHLWGEDAFDALDVLVPADLFVRDGQMLHTLLLNDAAEPIADIYVCCLEEDFILLAEGMTAAEIVEHAEAHLDPGLDITFDDLGKTHDLMSLNGPYAWEVMAEWLGPDIVGIPYLSFFHIDSRGVVDSADDEPLGICFRAGKTGEYGYDLLLSRECSKEAKEGIHAAGEPLDLRRASLEALDQCSLENGFFNVRAADWKGLTPLELQLQWRVSYRKDYVGSVVLAERRAEGARQRLTHVVAQERVRPGDPISLSGREVGVMVTAGYSHLRGDWVGQALLDRPLAHSGIDELAARAGSEAVPVRTVSAPVLNNRSLYVDPRRHSGRYREEEEFPPLVL